MSTTTSSRTEEVEALGEDCVGTGALGPLNADTYDFEPLELLLDFKSANDIVGDQALFVSVCITWLIQMVLWTLS